MPDPFEADWNTLVRKTRRRPLISEPAVIATADEVRIRADLSERLGASLIALGLGGVLTGAVAMGPGPVATSFLLVTGPPMMALGLWKLLFSGSIVWRRGSDLLTVSYGFVLFPRRLVLQTDPLEAELVLGKETNLPKGFRAFKILCLRRNGNGATAHVAFSRRSETAQRTLHQLSAMLGREGIDRETEAVKLTDGRTVSVKKTATWQAGHQYRYRAEVSRPSPDATEINRTPRAQFKKYPTAPAYPARIERHDDVLRLFWSNGDEQTLPLADCVGVQVCREELPMCTRYEVNLVLDAPKDNRINLVTVDPYPPLVRADPRQMVETISQQLNLPILDHL